jgi:hypothetical protein
LGIHAVRRYFKVFSFFGRRLGGLEDSSAWAAIFWELVA